MEWGKRSAVVVLIMALSVTARAGFEEGAAAYNSGDYVTALRELKPLAEKGNSAALFYLGNMYVNGEGVPKDDVEGMKWYRRAAEQGNADAQTAIGIHYRLKGWRERRSTGKFPTAGLEAEKWYQLAADQGYVRAPNVGNRQVPKEVGQALTHAGRECALPSSAPCIRRLVLMLQ